jgi:polyisoprenoid-binding protein YceI
LIANVLIKAFEFEKALMQQHFNENYLESEKFPKATFKGKLLNVQNLEFKSNWTKNIEFEGDLSIHGITRNIKNQASITFDGNSLLVSTEFYVLLKDFDIKIPSTLINNISEKVQVKVNLKMDKSKN